MEVNKPSDLLFVDSDSPKDWSLAVRNPELAKEWHPSKNGDLKAEDVAIGCKMKVWWICKNGHEWDERVECRNRESKYGCPYCSNHRVCNDNCLKVKNPELAKQWHLTKNGTLKPEDVVSSSNKKVWWICKRGHEWDARISSRDKMGCPYCSNQKACNDNCLKVKNPELAKQWHPTKNGTLKPEDVVPGSNKKVWWRCKRGHEWQAIIWSRNLSKKLECSFCIGLRSSKERNLSTLKPELAKQWHPTKNGTLKPENVIPGCKKKVWWVCKNGHEWQAAVYCRSRIGRGRNHGSNCPFCSGKKTNHDNCLAINNPELAKEFHQSKNGDLTPLNVVPGSGKMCWWRCKNGHEWQATVCNRNHGSDCPECRLIRRKTKG